MPRSDPGALAIALALAVLAAAGCGTGGSSTPSVLFTVQAVGSSPADGATGVRITQTVVAVRFDRDLDPASITTSTVQLLDLLALGAVVPGTVSYSAATREIRWQLTQSGLNPLQPTATVWDFARSYRLEISTRVRTAVGPRLPRAVTVEFQTEPAQLAIAGVLPAGASTTALIEPYTIFLPNNATMSAILAVTLNADVDPVTVTDTANVFVEEMTGGTPQLLNDQALAYDPASRTLGWRITQPQTGALRNTTYSAEPVLKFDTPYRLTIRSTVPILTPNRVYISGADLVFAFRTARFAGTPASPFPATESAQLLINEVLADVPSTASSLDLDANRDGVVDGSTDEFVEILNLTDDYLDLSELVITELSGSGSESAWFVLPGTAGSAPALGALLPPRRALVVFGGLNAGQSIDERALALGFSKYLLAGRPQGTSNARFNNPPTGDWVRLRLPSPSGPTAGDELSGMNFRPGSNGSTPSNDQSENRLPDATSGLNNITGHLNLNPAIPHSAGRRADGRPFD